MHNAINKAMTGPVSHFTIKAVSQATGLTLSLIHI